jgi:hypothetical protein
VAIYRDSIPRVSLAQVRSQFPPRVFARMGAVCLEHGGVAEDVAIETAHGSGAVALRPWFRCPQCGGLAGVLGIVDGRWGCRACGQWRSRNRRRLGATA